jgi:hypothetical protein
METGRGLRRHGMSDPPHDWAVTEKTKGGITGLSTHAIELNATTFETLKE